MPVVTAALGASPSSVALALQCEVDEINDRVVAALRHPIKPRTIGAGPCQERELIGKDASLADLPIVTWTPGKDKAPYITTIVITRNHDTGVQNMGVYRTMLRDAHSVVVNLTPGRQGTRNARTWTDRGKKAPIAWVIASEPAVHLATVANLPYGKDEIDFAGGLKGEPIELVRTRTIDLLVPANSEIVIEGEITPGELADEGPFGEFAGVMGPVEKRPVAHIKAITHRHDPLYYGYTSQMPPSESTTIQSLMNAGVILQMMRDHVGDQAVEDVFIDQTFGGVLAHAIVAITPQVPGHGKRVGRTIADITPVKRVTVVDADVDIRDPEPRRLGAQCALQPAARYRHHRRRSCPAADRSIGARCARKRDARLEDRSRRDPEDRFGAVLAAAEGPYDEGTRCLEGMRLARIRDAEAPQAAAG